MTSKQSLLKLDTHIRRRGFDYKLHTRDRNSAIYEQWDGEDFLAYEVFRIKIADPIIINKKYYPRRERFPGNEDFGKSAWSYAVFDDQEKALKIAMEKYNELQKSKSEHKKI